MYTRLDRPNFILCAITIFAAAICPAADKKPDGKGARPRQAPGIQGATADSGTSPITYHGGPVMLGAINVYYIFYGNWAANSAMSILPDLAANIGGSPYFNINASYSDSTGQYVSNAVNFAGSAMDAYSRGSKLADADVQTIVAAAIGSGKLGPADPNGVYFVLSSADVVETSGFCSHYCGWHTYATVNGVAVKYAFVGNGDQCPSACQAQTVSPNGNAGADGMSSVIAHELSEAATDPQLDAWYDAAGDENADKCAWSFGTTLLSPNGSKYNTTLGSRQFLLQRNWVNDGAGYCAIAWTRPAPAAPTADSAAPNAGSGTSQVFAFNYSSTGGFANLNDVYALFSGTLNGTGACWALYDKNAKGFYLVADSGYSLLGPLAPGAQGSLQNSQCTLNGATSSVGGAGNTLTMKLDLAFSGSFAATQNIYLYAADASGLNSGWQTRGSWTVPGPSAPVVGPVTPNAGSGSTQIFTFKYSSAGGFGYLKNLHALLNATLNGTGACWVLYDKPSNAFFLANDPGYGTVGPLTPGSSATIQNSQCGLSGAGSSATGSGNTLTMTLNLAFSGSFAGTQTIFSDAADASGANSGWQKGGTWTVPSSNPAPTANSVAPNSGGAANATFTFKYSSPNGSGSLSDVYLLFNGALNGAQACWIVYDKAANAVFLANDAATGTVGSAAPGTNATLQNSQCTVNLVGSTVSGSGNTLTLVLNLGFNHSFAGTQTIFLYAADSGGLNSGWQNRGSWTVP